MSDLFTSSRRIYTAIGASFGAFFPLVAVLLRIWQYGLSQLATTIKNDPLLWIIFSAPIFLGAAAWFAGLYQDRAVRAQYQAEEARNSVQKQVEEATLVIQQQQSELREKDAQALEINIQKREYMEKMRFRFACNHAQLGEGRFDGKYSKQYR